MLSQKLSLCAVHRLCSFPLSAFPPFYYLLAFTLEVLRQLMNSLWLNLWNQLYFHSLFPVIFQGAVICMFFCLLSLPMSCLLWFKKEISMCSPEGFAALRKDQDQTILGTAIVVSSLLPFILIFQCLYFLLHVASSLDSRRVHGNFL